MAKTSYIDVDFGLLDSYYANLTPQSRFTFARIAKKVALLSPARLVKISARSLLPQISVLWATLSPAEKLVWKTVAHESDLTNWRLFVQDCSARIRAGIPGIATPSLFHQSLIGCLRVEDPATELQIAQYHPAFYYVLHKVAGKKAMYEPVKITENFSLPLKIQLNYSSDLTSQGAGAFARFYARVHSFYQGTDIFTDKIIELDLSSGWQTVSAILSGVVGLAVHYDLYFHLFNVRGNLCIDNVQAWHNTQNWCRDTFCKNIDQAFTHAFYQIPSHWIATTLPDGSTFGTIYKDF
jgi:hypothetical protein